MRTMLYEYNWTTIGRQTVMLDRTQVLTEEEWAEYVSLSKQKIICVRRREYKEWEAVVVPQKAINKRQLVYNFFELNYLIRAEIMRNFGFPFDVDKPEQDETVKFLKQIEANDKLKQLRELIDKHNAAD